MATRAEIVSFARQLGGLTEAKSHGVPSLKGGKAILTRLRVDDLSIVLKDVHPDERDMLMAQAPEPFFTERHYLIYDIVPARIAFANMPRLAPFIERTWRLIAPKFLVVAHDIRGSVK